MALLQALTLFTTDILGFRHRDLREAVAELLGIPAARYGPGQITYDLRRLRLHASSSACLEPNAIASPRAARSPRGSSSGRAAASRGP